MAAITFQFSARESLSSEAIRMFEHGPWSHVDAVMPEGSLLGARAEHINGIPSGVQIRPSDYLPFSVKKIVSLEVPQDVADKFYALATSQIGKPYDFEALAGVFIGRNWRDEGSWDCSEVMAWCLESSVLHHPLAVPCNRVTPDDFYLVLSVLTNIGDPNGN
jgi:hypothetical protein